MSDQSVYWRMKNGKSIDVDLMDINHLRNVLKMIIRNNQKASQQLKSERNIEFKLNGYITSEFNTSHYSDLDDIHWSTSEFYKD